MNQKQSNDELEIDLLEVAGMLFRKMALFTGLLFSRSRVI